MRMGTWLEFKTWVDEEFSKYDAAAKAFEVPAVLFFRGQANGRDWKLETTLEREGKRNMPVADYYGWALRAHDYVANFGERHRPLEGGVEVNYSSLIDWKGMPHLAWMAHLRHHGFPSPLLDWSRSPYIAAYFAFAEIPEKSSEVRIYRYQEHGAAGKSATGAEARIVPQSPLQPVNERHAVQQCEYTICVKCWPLPATLGNVVFCSHDEALASTSPLRMSGQDNINFFTLPVTERKTALRDLFRMGITPHALFRSDEALIKTAALRCLHDLG